jgi:hypothetical protein
MGWLLDTDYDAATTPPGLSTQQLPLICEQVCRAINERKYARGQTLTEFYYTDALSNSFKKTYPTAADFAAGGCWIHGNAFKTIMQLGMTFVGSGIWYTSDSFTARYGIDSTPTIAATVSATLPAAANASKGVLWAPNWMYITRGLDLMKYCETPAPITSEMTVDYDLNQLGVDGFSFQTPGDTPEEAWGDIEWVGETPLYAGFSPGSVVRGVGASTPSPYTAGGGAVCLSPHVRDATNGGILTGCIRAVGVSVQGVSFYHEGSSMPKIKLNGTDTGLTATPTNTYRQVIIPSTSPTVEISVDYDEGPYEYPGLLIYGTFSCTGLVPDVDVLSDISSLLTDQS